MHGFKEDVEEKEGNLSKLANAVRKEKLEMPDWNISSVRISSESYWKRSLSGQLEFLLFKGGEAYSGINIPYMGRIFLSSNFDAITATHEIKHSKNDLVEYNHPEFRARWESLAVDENGKSYYKGYAKHMFSGIRFIGDIVSKEQFYSEENEKHGFIDSYAMTSYYEDVAETCETAESTYLSSLIRIVYKDKNEKIISKLKLAQSYGLIPEVFLDYLRIKKDFSENDETEKSEDLLEKSAIFLFEHPDTVYEMDLRNARGVLLEGMEKYDEAIYEFKKGLQAAYKDHEDYSMILQGISICYAQLRDAEKMKLYEKAKKLYIRGWKDNDVKTAIFGVNDFLRDNGENLSL